MDILKKIQSLTNDANNDIYNFSFIKKGLIYESLLKGFNENIYSIFNGIFNDLEVTKSIKDLFNCKVINETENQAALHHVYRDLFADKPNNFASRNFIQSCKNNINKCIELREELVGKKIKNIVTIGIGGSFEGPRLLIEALTTKNKRNFNHIFITGPDTAEFSETIRPLSQTETFFVVSSKSFNTEETLQTLTLAKNWTELKCNFNDHSIAITSQFGKAQEKGFKDNIIEFSDEVGGRYSIWSPISLPAILELGEDFKDFLIGGFQADCDLLKDEQYNKFIKLISFSDIWYNNFLNKNSRVMLVYGWKMRFISDYFQQLEMESLGKQKNLESIFNNTGQIIFGGFGSKAQHSYFQLLHQGTASICADILTLENNKDKNKLLYAQSQAQSYLLAKGEVQKLEPNMQINGNVPTNLFTLKKLNAKNLGYLIATWEHRTFITAKMLQINPFDQHGVSAGKISTMNYLKNHGG